MEPDKANDSAATQFNRVSPLTDLLVDALKELYWKETYFIKALPKMMAKATNDELVQALAVQLQETQGHLTRLKEVFSSIGQKAEVKKGDAMTSIIKETEGILSGAKDTMPANDVALIFAAQKAEHYGIAAYGGLITIAETLDLPDAAKIMTEALQKEKAADKKLTGIAAQLINKVTGKEDN